MVCRSIYNHSDKHIKGEPFEEVIKDADVLQHYLRNPMEDFFYEHRIVKRLIEELEL